MKVSADKIPIEDRKKIFYLVLLSIALPIITIASYINYFIYSFVGGCVTIYGVRFDIQAVIAAPVVEELLKFFGYGIIFFIDFNRVFKLEYKSKENFIRDTVGIAFLISVATFGFWEGMFNNASFPLKYFYAFIFLNVFIHITYSIYPLVMGMRWGYRKVICFIPIAMVLHALHNFIITSIWDNKWVTFSMVTLFLIPIIILKRKSILSLISRLPAFRLVNPSNLKICVLLILVLVYIYIILCCTFAF